MAFSDFIIFADESGSPVLEGPDPTFPVFVLNCVLVSKVDYADRIVHVWTNDGDYLIALQLQGPTGSKGIDAAKAVLLGDFGIRMG